MATVASLKGGWGRLAGWAGDFPESVPGGILMEVIWLMFDVMGCFKMFVRNKGLSSSLWERG